VDVVLDMVGGDYVPRNLACLTEAGRHVSIAFLKGPRAEIDIVAIMRRRLVLTGSTLRNRELAFKQALRDAIRELVWPLIAEGRIRPVIDSRFPLAKAAEAHRRLESGEHMGKIIIVADA
ncbi:MAG: NAD(P)H-quinone oxidoreductase, partial [Alphaproteobacteria bacterium]